MPAAARTSLLRFLTCGSVDDGKSTLIGRLLFESRQIFDDQLGALERDSRKHGTTGEDTDFALLVDGLEAEREQKITIDVAYRFFSTEKRKFIVADTPGHEQYTRNMATGASTCELAVIVVDAEKGVLPQTRRHATIVSLLGIRHVVLAVNKVDLVRFSEEVFARIAADFVAFAAKLGFVGVTAIPISARNGDNVTQPSVRTAWYSGPSLLTHLEDVDVEAALTAKPFRMPVQWVNRRDPGFRGFAGTVVSGRVAVGDEVVSARPGTRSHVERIVVGKEELREAVAGQAVTLVLADAIDISRGDMLADPRARPEVADQFAAHLLWLSDEEMLPNRQYLLKAGTQTTLGRVTTLKHKLDVNTHEHIAARTLRNHEIGFCNLSTAESIAFDPYRDNRDTGGFIVIDRATNATVGAGMIDFALRRASHVHRQSLQVHAEARAGQKGQMPCVLWFTGLSGSGKSTIANLVEARLYEAGRHTYLLDGDNVRHGLNRDLGFTNADRVENIRRVAETAKLFVDAGIITLVALISPFRSERRMAREIMKSDEFIEIFIDTPLSTCVARDPKGLYQKAAQGLIKNFTGIDSPYEPPENPELILDTETAPAEELAARVVAFLKVRGRV
ncbi:MAG: adenylyl-sulfate kinase [Deltaproteobacteria bacterium RBG_16_71_12]|nr:MAG: adenylyl-sulfate kinase [Deltaproteobacteria bacterium RBG_16_71_12]